MRPVASIQKALKEDSSDPQYTAIVHFKTDNGRNGINGKSPPLPLRFTKVDDNADSDDEVAYAVVNKDRFTNHRGTTGFVRVSI